VSSSWRRGRGGRVDVKRARIADSRDTATTWLGRGGQTRFGRRNASCSVNSVGNHAFNSVGNVVGGNNCDGSVVSVNNQDVDNTICGGNNSVAVRCRSGSQSEAGRRKSSRRVREPSWTDDVGGVLCNEFWGAPDDVQQKFVKSCPQAVTRGFIALQKKRDRGEIPNATFERKKDFLLERVLPAPMVPLPPNLARVWGLSTYDDVSHDRRREFQLQVSRALDQRAPPWGRLGGRDTSRSNMTLSERQCEKSAWDAWPVKVGGDVDLFGWAIAGAHPLFTHPEKYPKR